MDGAQFDRLSRLVARSVSRRRALTVPAALGVALLHDDAAAKVKIKCRGGCGSCKVCKKHGKKKCVTAADGTTCDGGTCQAGTCCLNTCTGLGNVCGPVSDRCGGPITCTCNPGATPACDGGRCATCATTCPSGCLFCMTRVDGTTQCGSNATTTYCNTPCSSDVDCPPSRPFCVIADTNRLTGFTTNVVAVCGVATPGVCADIPPC